MVLLAATSTSFAGWVASVYPEHPVDPGMAGIAYVADKSKGHAAFSGALKQLRDEGKLNRLKLIGLQPFIQDADYQKDLFSVLERNSPKPLQEALQSAGNMNNPKMSPLYTPFMEAVLDTSVVRNIRRELAAEGLKVRRASGEKLELIKDQGQRRFTCSLYLEIERIAESGTPSHDSSAPPLPGAYLSEGILHY